MADDQIPPIDPNLNNTTNSPTETFSEPPPVIPESPPNPQTFSNPPDIPDPSVTSIPSVPSEPIPAPTQEPEQKSPPQINIPDLSFPFYGSVSPSLLFNQVPDDERIKQKFTEWGIIGHNGLDFPLVEGTEILACDSGKVIQVGDNGDYGICVTIQHSWGQSVYAHLKETKVSVDQEVKVSELIGFSGQTGSAFGPHLHFAIKPNNPNESNGYLGLIDPAPYLRNIIQKPEAQKSEPPISSSVPPSPSIPSVEPEIKIEPFPEIPQPPQTFTPNEAVGEVGPQISEEEIKKQVDGKLASELETRRLKANEARKANREEHLAAIEKFLGQKPEITNQDVRDLVHVSQTTATEYLSTLTKSGRIKVEGKGKATVYKNIFG